MQNHQTGAGKHSVPDQKKPSIAPKSNIPLHPPIINTQYDYWRVLWYYTILHNKGGLKYQ